MTIAIYVVLYAAFLIFFVASIARAVRYARLPMHLRWELYPVPHEEPDHAEHGGSYYESVDWWRKARHRNLWGELKFMIPEMVFLKGLWEFNRPLWFRSFPFHFGLYLLMLTIGLVVLSAVLTTAVLRPLYVVTGVAGLTLAMAGAIGLLLRRLTDEKLKNYSAPADIFNLMFFMASFGLLMAGYACQGTQCPGAVGLARGLLTFDTSLTIPPVIAGGLVLNALLVAYIPLTHMSHFIAKYFTYHSIRWDDDPNVGAREMAKKIARSLSYRPTWTAPHVGADGARTWADIATTNPAAGGRK